MLAISGQLNPQKGGPSVIVPIEPDLVKLLYNPAQWAVNPDHKHSSAQHLPLSEAQHAAAVHGGFDSPDMLLSCPRREAEHARSAGS